jgi:hypothetical protein
MKKTYGKDAKAVFYASKNKGVIKGVEKKIQILTVVEQRAKVAGKPQQAAIAKRGKEAIRKQHGKKKR